tara:strand:- start:1133 stop:1516 length:384 start_codon:yes stop_codon:yes gene_type:complete
MRDEGRFQGDMDRNEVEMDLNKFMAMVQEIGALKDKIRDLEDESTKNPHQRWIFLASAIDSWRIFPRIFVVVYIYLMYESVMWFMALPEPNIEQSALVSVVVGAMGVVFGVYSGKTGQSKGFKGEDK